MKPQMTHSYKFSNWEVEGKSKLFIYSLIHVITHEIHKSDKAKNGGIIKRAHT